MKNKNKLSAIFGLLVTACDDGHGSTSPNDVTWTKGSDRLVISGTNYIFRSLMGGTLYDVSKGTFTADTFSSSGEISINQTHAINTKNCQLEVYPITETGDFSGVTANTFTLAGFSFFPVNGIWTKY
jgi:hypothetical protein